MVKKREVREPYILFGEGPTEALFLGLFKQYFSQQLSRKRIVIGNGHGGSAGSILLELKKKHFDTGDAKIPALVLLDEDNGLDKGAEKILQDYDNIQVVLSKPECLEGLLLDLLDDLPPLSQRSSARLKRYFQDHHLGTREQVQKVFKQKRYDLLPLALFDAKKNSNEVVKAIFAFLALS